MPGARCTRGLVRKKHKGKRTRAYRFSGGNPTFPAQWFDGLLRALPGDQDLFVTVAPRMMAEPPGWAGFASLGTWRQPWGVRTTRLRRTLQRRSSGVPDDRSRKSNPPCDPVARPTLPRPPHPVPRFVTIAKRPSSGTRRRSICRWFGSSENQNIFCYGAGQGKSHQI